MANISKRRRKDGGYSYRVQWVMGGGAASPGCTWGIETFTTRPPAVEFKAAVEAADHQWPRCPETGVVWTKGKGFVKPDPAKGPVSFEEVAEAYFAWNWEEAVEALRTKDASQWDRDKSTYRRILQPVFGAAKFPHGFVTIEADDIAKWRNDYLGGRIPGQKKLSAKTFKNHHTVLSSIMKHGQMRMRLRPDNPCNATAMPKIPNDKDIRFFHHAEWKIFRECLHESARLMMDVAISTGVRWGELSAIRKGDCLIDLETGDDGGEHYVVHIHVVRAWKDRGKSDKSPIKEDEFENGSWKLGPPKNGRPRWVSISGPLAQTFAEEISHLHADDYVFVTRHGNPWRYPDFHTDRWSPAVKAATERGVTKHLEPHMLRHTMVVWALADGVKIEVISEKLGHASIQITYDKYGGLIDLKNAEVAKAMAKQLLIADQAIVPQAKPVKVVQATNTTVAGASSPTRIARRQAGKARLARSKAS